MDDTFCKARGEYDERRDSLIAARYKDVAQANIVRDKWEQVDEIVFEMANSFSLLPNSSDCVMQASWELASYDYVLSSRLGPEKGEIGQWASRLWERISEKCNVLIPDLMAWHHLANVLWQDIHPILDRPHPASPRTPKAGPSEKKSLEKVALEIFISELNCQPGANWHIKRFQAQERPDAVLEDAQGNLLGVEITHAYHDSEEAKVLLGRSITDFSGLQSFDELLAVVKDRISDKSGKISSYGLPYPISLIVRVASPIFTFAQFRDALATQQLKISKGSIHEVWTLVRSDDDPGKYTCLRLG